MLLQLIDSPLGLSLSTFVSEDLAYIYGIYSLQNGRLSPISFVLFYSAGVLVGDLGLYLFGYLGRYSSFIRQRLIKFQKKIDHPRFNEFLLLTRFIPGTRLPTYLICGLLNFSLLKFLTILAFSTVCFASCGVALVLLFGRVISDADTLPVRILYSIGVSLIVLTSFRILTKTILTKKKYGEIIRPLWIRISRLKSLEFWNSWFLYLPFVPRFCFLLVKYHGFKDCLNANPALHMSGFIGEKKSEIDSLLLKFSPKNYYPVRSISKESDLSQFSFPLVLKPDSGLRGIDVFFFRDKENLSEFLSSTRKSFVAQQYCPHPHEIGVYYVRHPGESRGNIFSVTKKILPFVVGDGQKNLFQLVMDDLVLRPRYDWLFANQELNPFFIPQNGQKILLSQKGSHSKGCLFYEGFDLIPYVESIRTALDTIEGFNIGRADIKYENTLALSRGEFVIIELNGAGAESTNIYDPKYNASSIYQILYSQWKLIFEFGKFNSNNNQFGPNLFQFFKEIFLYKRQRHKISIS